MNIVSNAAISLVVGLFAFAPATVRAAPPPPPGAFASDGMRSPPPPPPGGAAVVVDRKEDHTFHVDVRCAQTDTTRACADIATQLLDKLNTASPAK